MTGLEPAPGTAEDPEGAAPAPLWRRLISSVGPWLIAGALVAYVFSRVPIADAWSVAQDARLDVFVPLIFGAVVGWFVIESFAYAFLFSRFNAAVSVREALALRGMSYLLTPIHWNVGKAAVILRLRQTKQIPMLESTSSVMLYQAIDGLILAAFAALGVTLLIAGGHGDPGGELGSLRTTTGLVGSFILFNIILTRATWPRFRPLDWWRELSIHHAHRRVMPADVCYLLAVKGTYYFLYVLVFYYGTRAFGIELPFALVLAATPIIQLVGGLPITPAGLGTQQAAMLYFFGETFGGSGAEANIVAFGFSLPVALILGRCLLGLFYLRDLSLARPSLHPATALNPAPALDQAAALNAAAALNQAAAFNPAPALHPAAAPRSVPTEES